MIILGRLALSGLAGAALSSAFFFTPLAASPPPRLGFPPDLLALGALFDVAWPPILFSAIAGAVTGVALSLALRNATGGSTAIVDHLLAFTNPAALFACSVGPEMMLAFAAALVLWRAAAMLAADRNYGSTVALGVALAAASILSNSALVLYPILLLIAPLFSPWGLAPRKLAGFMMAIAAPALMTAASLAYLYWLFEIPIDADAGAFWRRAASSDFAIVLFGALVIAVAGRRKSRLALAGAFLAALAVVALLNPEFAAEALVAVGA